MTIIKKKHNNKNLKSIKKSIKDKAKKDKTAITNLVGGGGSPPQSPGAGDAMDLQSLTEEDIKELGAQGLKPKDLADIAIAQGQPVPPLIEKMLGDTSPVSQNTVKDTEEKKFKTIQAKVNNYPALMDVATYKNYDKDVKQLQQSSMGAHKPNVYGFEFSNLINEELLKEMKHTQGSFFVGINLSNLFNEFHTMIADDKPDNKNLTIDELKMQKNIANKEKDKANKEMKKNPENIFNKFGEWVDVDFDYVLDKKLGFRGSDVPLLPEVNLSDYSTFYEILGESTKYSTKSGFDGKITPYGLIMMTRMLFKYKNNNAQWLRVATVLELIYKYLNTNMSRKDYFNTKDEIPIRALIELEEFYNTDHIFMTQAELIKFKKDLEFYKIDKMTDIKAKLQNVLKKKVKYGA